MTPGINRRQLLTNGVKAGLGLALIRYGSGRLVIRKGQLLINGEQPLVPVEPNVFRPAGDGNEADRLVFDMLVNGQATRMNYSGIEFFRTFTP